MNSIIGKLSSYQILTNLLPGAFFIWMLKFLFGINMSSENIVEVILIYYFVGLIINRVSAIIIKPALRWRFFLVPKQKTYSEFIKAEKIDSKIDVLSEASNCFRAFLTSALLLTITYGLVSLYSKWMWFATNWKWFAVLFFVAYKRQTALVCRRIEEIIEEEQKRG